MNEKVEKCPAEYLRALRQFERGLKFTQTSETIQNRHIFLQQKVRVFIRWTGYLCVWDLKKVCCVGNRKVSGEFIAKTETWGEKGDKHRSKKLS
jgi:hypothetical protein